jgi:hypothetical protein
VQLELAAPRAGAAHARGVRVERDIDERLCRRTRCCCVHTRACACEPVCVCVYAWVCVRCVCGRDRRACADARMHERAHTHAHTHTSASMPKLRANRATAVSHAVRMAACGARARAAGPNSSACAEM